MLLRRGHLVASLAREIEGDAADALDLVGVVDLRVDAALLAVAEVADFLGLAEIDAAGQFADDDDVEALDHLRLQRRGAGERGIADRRADVGVEREILAQAQQARLRPHLIGHVGPFRAADRRQQHRVGGLRARHVGVADRLAMRVEGAAADQPLFSLEACAALFVEEGDHLLRFGHHLGADAVAGEQENLVRGHETSGLSLSLAP